jgi:hypothetical protein
MQKNFLPVELHFFLFLFVRGSLPRQPFEGGKETKKAAPLGGALNT